jgi:hypothetical protein
MVRNDLNTKWLIEHAFLPASINIEDYKCIETSFYTQQIENSFSGLSQATSIIKLELQSKKETITLTIKKETINGNKKDQAPLESKRA